MKTGKLYGIGVGPGAADLLTVRAVNALGQINVVLAAASSNNDYSRSLEIAWPYLPASCRIERLDFPMTRDNKLLVLAWRKAAMTTRDILAQGCNAAFLTLGDPLIYSTFSYLLSALRELAPQTEVEIIPGVTSFQAAAAKSQRSLCEGTEHLTIVSGIVPETELVEMLNQQGNVAILKVYRNFAAIRKALEITGRARNAIIMSNVEQAEETMGIGLPDSGDKRPPYMTLIISKRADTDRNVHSA